MSTRMVAAGAAMTMLNQVGAESGQAEQCATCSECGSQDDLIRFWDGRDYCQSCVNQFPPAVRHWLEQNPDGKLVEMRSDVGSLSGVACTAALTAATCWAGAAILGASFLNGVRVALVAFVLAVAALQFVRFVFWGLGGSLVTVENGILQVRLGLGKIRCDVRGCRWHRGTLRGGFTNLLTTWRRAIIVHAGDHTPDWFNTRIAVGTTPEMYDVWNEFFGMLDRRRQSKDARAAAGEQVTSRHSAPN